MFLVLFYIDFLLDIVYVGFVFKVSDKVLLVVCNIVKLLYIACIIFGRNDFFNELGWI